MELDSVEKLADKREVDWVAQLVEMLGEKLVDRRELETVDQMVPEMAERLAAPSVVWRVAQRVSK